MFPTNQKRDMNIAECILISYPEFHSFLSCAKKKHKVRKKVVATPPAVFWMTWMFLVKKKTGTNQDLQKTRDEGNPMGYIPSSCASFSCFSLKLQKTLFRNSLSPREPTPNNPGMSLERNFSPEPILFVVFGLNDFPPSIHPDFSGWVWRILRESQQWEL